MENHPNSVSSQNEIRQSFHQCAFSAAIMLKGRRAERFLIFLQPCFADDKLAEQTSFSDHFKCC